ncbi:peptide ABC transporter [Candidatus Epulonipiscium fishelsonii]|uniref:Peptide ABC transporter n=1 Tax=Candidatus Epulonipiscium fishelsonii TaxID=77094 RepID=A0ACC8XB43_9FIRM|nr:peptide ABC transporter [Epulopiscium sp. SCG-B11WGA-EpuloA1]ONI41975.1 peptide ABC transporter [Epulopiscium sp. SCG-B05WGA-EpuloA1]
MNKKLLYALLSLCTLGTITGCSSNEPQNISEVKTVTSAIEEQAEPAEDVAQEMTFVLSNLPDGLDPGVTDNSFSKYVLYNTFEGLVTYDQTGSLVPGLAKDWSISEDGRTYTFNLRPDLKWSDGTPLTASDFVYSILRVATPETASRNLNMVTDYIVNAQEYLEGKIGAEEVGVKAIDDSTLEITLKEPISYYIDILSMWVYSPVQQATVEANGDAWSTKAETYVSNGPFKVSEMSISENVVLEKNENYWNADNVKLEKINFRYILDTSTALTAYEAGEVDGIASIPPTDYARLRAEDKGVKTYPTYGTIYYLINNGKAPYDNLKVREALNLALDRQLIVDNIVQLDTQPAYSLLPPGYEIDGIEITEGRGTFGMSPSAEVEKAQQALADAGYPNGENFPVLELSYYSDDVVKKVVEAMAQMWETNLNIDVEVSSNEWVLFYEDVMEEDYSVAAMGLTAYYFHPMGFLTSAKTGDIANLSVYSNPEYDALVEQIKTETDPNKSIELIRQADALVSDDYFLIPLYYKTSDILLHDNIQGAYMNAQATLFFKDTHVTGKQ